MLLKEVEPAREVTEHVNFRCVFLFINIVLVTYHSIEICWHITSQNSMKGLTAEWTIITITGPALSIEKVNTMITAVIGSLPNAP